MEWDASAVGVNVIVGWRYKRFFNEPLKLRGKKPFQQYGHRAKRDHKKIVTAELLNDPFTK